MATIEKVVACLMCVILATLSVSCNFPGNRLKERGVSAEIKIIPIEQSLSYGGKEWPNGTLFMSATLTGLEACPQSPLFSAAISKNPKWTRSEITGAYEYDFISREDLSQEKILLKSPENPMECYYEQIIQDAFAIQMLTYGNDCAIDSLVITFDAYDGDTDHIWSKTFSCDELRAVLYEVPTTNASLQNPQFEPIPTEPKEITNDDEADSVVFQEHVILTSDSTESVNPGNRANSLFSLDMSVDGIPDIIVAAYAIDSIFWLENFSNGKFNKHIVTDNFDGVMSAQAVDLDSDGYVDIVGASQKEHTIAWWKNDGTNTFHRIDIGGHKQVVSTIAVDLDRDEDIDIVSGADCAGGGGAHVLAWWENDGKGNFQNHQIGGSCLTNYYSLAANDIDGDGDIDIVTSDSFSGPRLFQNNGDQSFTPIMLYSPKDRPNSVYLVDFDLDGDIDILDAGNYGGYIVWWEYNAPGEYDSHLISENVNVVSIFPVDIDNDGDLDILGACEGNGIKWWKNDGSFNFTMMDITSGISYSVIGVDIDRDGDFDIISSTDRYGITWWENLHK